MVCRSYQCHSFYSSFHLCKDAEENLVFFSIRALDLFIAWVLSFTPMRLLDETDPESIEYSLVR